MLEAAIAAVDEANEEDQENQGQKRADLDKEMEKTLNLAGSGRKERRKAAKKLKRKQARITIALEAREEEEARKNDPEEQRRIMLKEQQEAEIMERHRKEFEERERVWIERAVEMAEEEERKMMLEDESRENQQMRNDDELNDDDAWDSVEEGPAEIIWQGNEIIVKKKSVRVPKRVADQQFHDQDADRPTSNPLPPQSEAFASYKSRSSVSSQEVFRSVAQQTPNFGTEQDKANCPFHIKTGACRFGLRCSRVHFYPDKSCTLLIKNMYNGPGIAWEQDEGLEFTDEEVERSYEEFYEDVHTEFLKFGEIVNFKVCKNGSFHLRGNVYVHYKSLESSILAYHSINGRYFAGKLITCEYVGVTKWKVAICGEYMKSRLKTCSHGTACNFIHCFRNPGGDYEWADWDNPPPKYWVKKMAALFGPSDETTHEKCTASDGRVQPWNSNRKITQNYDSRYHSRRSRSKDVDSWDSSSGGDTSDEDRKECGSHSSRQKHSGSSRENELYNGESGKHKENSNFENDQYQGKNMTQNYDSGDSSGKDQDRGGSLSRTHSHHHKKGEVFPDDDDHNYDKNGVAEYDKYGGKEIRSHSSSRKHSKSKDRSSRRESMTRQTKKQKFSNAHVISVDKYETGRINGYGCRNKSNDRRSELNFGGNIDHYDRWEATYSEENEKSGCSNFDNEELCGGTLRSYDERHDMHDIKISSRCQSQSSHGMRLNSLDGDTGSSEYEGYYEAKRSHEHRRKGKRATSETFSSERKSEYENTRAHDLGEHQSCRSSRRHHQSSNRRGKHEDYDKEDKVENSQLKRSRSRSPAQCSRRSKREK